MQLLIAGVIGQGTVNENMQFSIEVDSQGGVDLRPVTIYAPQKWV